MEKQRLQFESRPENIVVAEKMIDQVCEELNLSEDNYGNILIAVTEAVNNAICHGNKQNPDKKVNIDLLANGKSVSFVVSDEGEGFDHENLPDPTDPVNIEKVSGRGVFLMRQLADKVEFSEGGKQVEIVFALN